MIVTIDGPAGAGKSTAARHLARELGFEILDTGAMYRAVTLEVLKLGVDLDDAEEVARVARGLRIEFKDSRVLADGVDVTAAIRESRVTTQIGKVADNPAVRSHLVRLQREMAGFGNFVCEGRDQGTVAFPDAFCKFFLTASPEQRARRRLEELRSRGVDSDYDGILEQQIRRDREDESRPVGRLVPAADAIEIDTDDKTLDEVVGMLKQIVLERMAESNAISENSKS